MYIYICIYCIYLFFITDVYRLTAGQSIDTSTGTTSSIHNGGVVFHASRFVGGRERQRRKTWDLWTHYPQKRECVFTTTIHKITILTK